jgi:uncharacterized protein (TIGR03118 family)
MKRSSVAVGAVAMLAGCLGGPSGGWALDVGVTNLVTDDQTAHPAVIEDPTLVNPWGVSRSGTSPFWVSDNGTGRSTLYSVDPSTGAPTKLGLEVTIPGTGAVTGQVFNGTSSSGTFNGDLFLFVSEDGTISGWRNALGTTAETLALPSTDSVYKGSTFGTSNGNSYLYAANFMTGAIDVMKGSAGAPDLAAHFTDPNLPSGYAPFNIQNLGDSLFVTYAVQDASKRDDVAGLGNGIVDVFDLQGNFVRRVATGGDLNSPWGLALAPSSFAALAGDLLVGNFGDGKIHVYDPSQSGAALDVLTGPGGQPLEIDGLWALIAGNGGSGGSLDSVYFTAGPDGEAHGLFGVLSVPEPGSGTLLALGLVVLARRGARRAG